MESPFAVTSEHVTAFVSIFFFFITVEELEFDADRFILFVFGIICIYGCVGKIYNTMFILFFLLFFVFENVKHYCIFEITSITINLLIRFVALLLIIFLSNFVII